MVLIQLGFQLQGGSRVEDCCAHRSRKGKKEGEIGEYAPRRFVTGRRCGALALLGLVLVLN